MFEPARTHRRRTQFSFLTFSFLLAAVTLLQGCFLQQSGGSTTNNIAGSTADGVNLNWEDYQTKQSGYWSSVLPYNAQGSLAFVCFENNNASCQRANDSVRLSVGNTPVVVHSFALNLGKPSGTTSVTVSGATVTTAELQFDTVTGAMRLGTPITRTLTGSGCDLSQRDSVGIAPSTDGRIVTALYFMEQAISYTAANAKDGYPGNVQYFDGYLSSGRVWYSGLLPVASDDSGAPFRFSFSPAAAAAQANWGMNGASFQSSVSNTGSYYYLPQNSKGAALKFGVDEDNAAIANKGSHVLTGFCVNGTRVQDGRTRPLFLGAEVHTYRPHLSLADE